ncbi:peptidoglycan-binding domain-containing protein [Streptomyces cyslabdanicus]|uniref:peptidoglycan-binding domain-containing protein n=1 Tax=Streptomyces cyslabdanicus TaxID=1470456 RepID=UPI004044B637
MTLQNRTNHTDAIAQGDHGDPIDRTDRLGHTDPTDMPSAVRPNGTAPSADPAPRRRRRRPMRTALIVLAALSVAGAAEVAATGALDGGGDDQPSAAPSGPSRTAEVELRTLTRTQTVEGTLGYGTATPVQAPGAASGSPGGDAQGGRSGHSADSPGAGIVTALPGEGDTIRRGESVYSVDDQKVPLLYGSIPLYRTLRVGSEGKDVAMLEKNLAELGYTGFTVDNAYTSATAEAVRAWQDDLGREQTGTVAPGEAVVAPGARRVAEVGAAVGTTPTGEILTWSGTERSIGVDLDVRYEDLVDDGTKATVRLPDGTSVEATVTDVGTAATAASDGSGGGRGSGGSGGSPKATLPVQLSVKNQKKLGRYQAAPVDVTLEAETREDVLAVPVEALTARREDGYAVQAVRGGQVEYLPVKLGMFANGMVEISGDGITEGLVVGVPQ